MVVSAFRDRVPVCCAQDLVRCVNGFSSIHCAACDRTVTPSLNDLVEPGGSISLSIGDFDGTVRKFEARLMTDCRYKQGCTGKQANDAQRGNKWLKGRSDISKSSHRQVSDAGTHMIFER